MPDWTVSLALDPTDFFQGIEITKRALAAATASIEEDLSEIGVATHKSGDFMGAEFEKGCKRAGDAAAGAGDKVGKSFSASSLRAVMGGTLVLKGIEAGIGAITVATAMHQQAQAAASGDSIKYAEASAKVYESQNDLVRVLPIVGGAITRLRDTITGGTAAFQKQIEEISGWRASAEGVAQMAASFSAAAEAYETSHWGTALDQAEKTARDAQTSRIAQLKKAKDDIVALGGTEASLRNTEGNSPRTIEATAKLRALLQDYESAYAGHVRQLANEDRTLAEARQAAADERLNKDSAYYDAMQNEAAGWLKTETDNLDSTISAYQSAYERKINIAREAGERIASIERGRAQEAESWEERMFRRSLKGLNENQIAQRSGSFARSLGTRAQSAEQGGDYGEARRVYQRQIELFDAAGWDKAMNAAHQRLMKTFDEESGVAKQQQMSAKNDATRLQDSMETLRELAVIPITLDAKAAYDVLSGLSDEIEQFRTNVGLPAATMPAKPTAETRNLEGGGPMRATIGQVTLNFSADVSPDVVRNRILPELQKLLRRNQT